MTTVTNNIQSNFLGTEEEIILQQIDELQKDLDAIQRLRKKYSSIGCVTNGNEEGSPTTNKASQPVKTVQEHGHKENSFTKMPLPTEYTSRLTWEQRIIYILNEIGGGYVDDVVKRIREHEPSVSLKTAANVATNKLSKMYRYRKIKADTSGKKYKYHL